MVRSGGLAAFRTEKDLTAAGTWLLGQNAHPAYGPMASAHAVRVAAEDSAAAFAWADSIPDASARNAAREAAAREALRARGSEAHASLTAAGFSDSEVADLTKLASQRGLKFYANQIDEANASLESRVWLDTLSGNRQEIFKTGLQAQTAAEGVHRLRAADSAVLESLATGTDGGLSAVHLDEITGLSFSPAGLALPGVTALHPRYSTAHPGGAPANCTQCHQ